jgi:hypothetical protein
MFGDKDNNILIESITPQRGFLKNRPETFCRLERNTTFALALHFTIGAI